MAHFGPFAVAVFVFVSIAAVAGIVGDYKKRRLAPMATAPRGVSDVRLKLYGA